MAPVTVAIIGGGITGLAAAHRLIESAPGGEPPRIVVLEAGARPGGQIATVRHGEFLFEGGPDALVAQKPQGVALCGRLGLGGQLRELSGTGTQIYRDGKLHRVPDGFLMMAPTRLAPVLASSLFTWRGKLRMAAEPFVPKRSVLCDDESLTSFVTRRFGREIALRVAEPVIAGLYTADADRLSLRMTMPRFLDLEASDGSVTRALRKAAASRSRPFGHGTGRSGFVALTGGLTGIVAALTARLPVGSLKLNARATSVASHPAGYRIALEDGETLTAAAVLFACPGGEAAQAVTALDPPLAERLRGLRYASCATVNIAYRSGDVGVPLEGLGFFVPRTEGLPILACSYVSEKFQGRAPSGTVVFRAFIGGATRPEALGSSDPELIEETHDTLRRILSIAGQPLIAKVHRWPAAMPQFDVGAKATVDAIAAAASAHPGLFVAGSVSGAYGLPDCIRSGEEAADRIAAFLTVPGSSSWVAYQANQNA